MREELIQDGWPPITMANIATLESNIKMSLPEDYAAFLLRQNGGRCADRMEFMEIIVQQFYGINSPYAWGDLRSKVDVFVGQHRMPSSCIPIACDPFGNQIVLACSGSQLGKVFSWDHEKEPQRYGQMFLMASSFSEFLSGIEIRTDEPSMNDVAFRAIQVGDHARLEQLLESGLNPNHCAGDEVDQMPLLAAAVHYGRLAMMDRLRIAGADLESPDGRGDPPIFYTCGGAQSSSALTRLLEWGVSPNSVSDSGTPLIVHAVSRRAGNILAWLALRQDLDVSAPDSSGMNALDCAKRRKDRDTERLLSLK